jgi:hypothetical protein
MDLKHPKEAKYMEECESIERHRRDEMPLKPQVTL